MHGGVDGYTRLPVYLRAGTNNTAATVLGLFQQAVDACKERTDRGGENVEVSMYMLQHPQRGPGRGSMITGRSVHNQRIERLWRDVFEGVLYIYYHLFYHLEECCIIDPANQLHLYGLHYTYVPRINQHLDTWREGYIRHRIRTAGNRSPMQLYILGLLRMRGSDSLVAREMYEPRTDVSKYIVPYPRTYMYHFTSDTRRICYRNLMKALASSGSSPLFLRFTFMQAPLVDSLHCKKSNISHSI